MMEKKDFYLEAIRVLYDKGGEMVSHPFKLSIERDGVFVEVTPIELSEIEAEAAQLLIAHNNATHVRDRQKEIRHPYRLFKLLYDDMINNTSTFQDRMEHIINKHPKP